MPDSTPGHPSRGSSSAGGEGASGSATARLDLAAAEAEAAAAAAAATAAAAEANAAAARAHAARLRRDTELGAEPAGFANDPAPMETRLDVATPGRRPKGRARTIALVVAVVTICASLAVTGYAFIHHWMGGDEREQAAQIAEANAEYAAAAKQGVMTLTSLDFNNASGDIQRVLDNSTGEFRDDFQSRKDDFTKVIEQSQVTTEGEVSATAVESMTDDSAVVLVSSTSKVTNSAGAQQEPRVWRLAVTVTREGDQLKMSKVDFVP